MYSMTNTSPGPLSPILISQDTGKRYPATKAGRAQLDADEGRVRLYNDQMESMIVLRGCLVVMRKAVDNLKPFVRKTGKGRMMSAAVGLLYKATADMMSKVSAAQCATMDANTKGVTVSVSSAKVPAYVNIDHDDLLMITDRALEACEMYCTADCQASKSCLLRKAFEQVPMLGELRRGAGAQDCPYMGVRLEAEHGNHPNSCS